MVSNNTTNNTNTNNNATTMPTTSTSTADNMNITAADVADMPFTELELRKAFIEERLKEITIEDPHKPVRGGGASGGASSGGGGNSKKGAALGNKSSNKSNNNNNNTTAAAAAASKKNPTIPYNPKTEDTHWDFCMKEMMWLGADFQAERKRQVGLAKKCSASLRQYHKSKESRRLRELNQAEMKRRKLAARLGREFIMKGWWTKIEKVIAYKQKLSADEERKKAMNKQLVTLVQQTEKYSELLMANQKKGGEEGVEDDDEDDDDEEDEDDDDEEDGNNVDMSNAESEGAETASSMEGGSASDRSKRRRKRRKQKQKTYKLTIEEALARDTGRKSKSRIIDYSRLRLETDEFYGESTASDASASDASYSPESDISDDETTLQEAIQDELTQRRSKRGRSSSSSSYHHSTTIFSADPEEIRKLHEEQDMAIEKVIERLQEEAAKLEEEEEEMETTATPEAVDSSQNKMNVDDKQQQQKKVQFSETVKEESKIGAVTSSSSSPSNTPDDCASRHETADTAAVETVKSTSSATVSAPVTAAERPDPGNDADDDGDASDVEDYKDSIGSVNEDDKDDDDSGEEEFEAGEPEADDETTMIQEESLPQEMSREQEIDLLKQESEMSIEELRARYARMDEDNDGGGDDDEEEEEEQSETVSSTNDGDDDKTKKTGAMTSRRPEKEETKEPKDSSIESARPTVDDKVKSPEASGPKPAPTEATTDNPKPADTTKNDQVTPKVATESSSTPTPQSKVDDDAKLNAKNAEGGDTLAALADNNLSDSDADGGGEFQPDEKDAVDDETTIAAEEKMGRDMSYQEEIDLLQRESEMPVDQLRAMYAKMYQADEDDENDESSDSKSSKQSVEESSTNVSSVPVAAAAATTTTRASSTAAEMLQEGDEDVEDYTPNEAEAVDDETTIEIEERMGREMSHEEEMELLQKENEIPVEKLREMYGFLSQTNDADEEEDDVVSEPTDIATRDDEETPSTKELLLVGGGTETSDVDAEEFEPNEAECVDDETTMEAEERLGRDMSYEDELALLQKENEMSVEELRKMYAGMDGSAEQDEGVSEGGSVKQEDGMDVDVDEAPESSSTAKENAKRSREPEDESTERPEKISRQSPEEDLDDGQAALDALEASAERARQTLATRPYLLAGWVKLRRYQQVGLNWLVSLQSRRLNGILADEMGLGKTLQTISLLAYLASFKGIWGPHLVVVPTSVIINWETELKRFAPALKVLCYYGSAKRRKELRTGWTKTNWYHVVITSYQLAVQDAFAFKRKKWYYLILDEAQNIKNFQSQRWQTLINFNTQRRLLLTGTPLQNNLMELWSLLHFLMPYIFRSRKEFSYWFSNPMNNIIEGNTDKNDDVIRRLHGIIRPFVLRRLKKDVETQMPGKYEHIVKCQLSRRQMTLYEEFLSRSSTRQALKKGGNFMGMMNVLMQLRKVCNHPDLFEARSVVTPFVAPSLSYDVPSCVCDVLSATSVSDRLSANILNPLWCGSTGLPSVGVSLRHCKTEAEQLRRLRATYDNDSLTDTAMDDSDECPKELRALVREINKAREKERTEKAASHERTNKLRCDAPAFAYSESLQDLICTEISVLDREEPVELRKREILLTPSQLLKMRMTSEERADGMESVIEKYVFCVPRAGAKAPAFSGASKQDRLRSVSTTNLEEMLLEPLEEYFRPFMKAHARLSSFFPDKKLIQYDAGKLQTLAELLHNLKKGGHRVLIFTQMSKMLDILEAFLNINGHTYLRLDGATGVERRQRYMDRFNNDTKIFSFILSTRSGGMGINLTGADTVIFFDSDWNPAMDAQAQDRAHRIGQTRDVHIYRLITEHTIEENILSKAKQKRNLDIMVMDQGKFDASQGSAKESTSSGDTMKDVFTKGGLRAILGVTDDEKSPEEAEDLATELPNKETGNMSKEQMEQAMAELEDEDDVKALRGAQKEAAEEAKEFDETAEVAKESDGEDDDETGEEGSRPAKKQKTKKKESKEKAEKEKADQQENTDGGKNEENDLEKEFAAWQSTVGFDASAIESTLSPMERYGMNFREKIDPFYSIFAINEQQRKLEATEGVEEIDITEIEREKAAEEQAAMDEGDLLATYTRPEDLVRQRNLYRREKARLRAEKKRRRLTGEEWLKKTDGLTQKPFWYNTDTGEALWDKPLVLMELEAHDLARENGWVAMPRKPLVRIMEFLIPFPERQTCSTVCRHWRAAAQDIQFVRHIYPVEMGALGLDPSRREPNHYPTIDEALSVCLPGDTIELSDGHYWVSDPGLLFNKPLQLIGDEKNPANVVVEMSGSVQWTAKSGWIEGVTFRRPKISTGEPPAYPMIEVPGGGKVDLFHCVFDNDGSTGPVVKLSGTGRKGHWRDAIIRNGGSCGIEIHGEMKFELTECIIRGNKTNGLECKDKANFTFHKCKVERNGGYGVQCGDSSCSGEMQKCHFASNMAGVIKRATGCFISCSHNTAIVETPPKKQIPGFKLTHVIESESGGVQSSGK